jgi:lipoprotein-anchoring transpeptidase ErfK/SrfK
MRRHARPHPLQSFRFWFVILAAAGVAAAWKLDLLPAPQRAAPPESAASDVDLGTSVASGPFGEETFRDGFLGQSEPGTEDENSEEPPAPPPGSAGSDMPRVMPRVSRIPEHPFGPARPEFVAAPHDQPEPGPDGPTPAFTRNLDSDRGPAGSILQAVNEESTSASPPPAAAAAAPTAVVPSSNSVTTAAAPAALDLSSIDALLESGDPQSEIEAHRTMSKLYWEQPQSRAQLRERIDAAARRIYFQSHPHYMDACVVQPGDTLEALAKPYDVTWEYLARLNRVDPARIRAGQKLKVIKGPFSAIVDLSDFELTVHCHGYYVFRFPVGIGRDGATPLGTFPVRDKVVNPPYDGPEGSFAADDPANPIGERWISLGDGYGIHGTIEPDSVGNSESRGCVRMHDKDVEIVYDLLTIGSEVVIQR